MESIKAIIRVARVPLGTVGTCVAILLGFAGRGWDGDVASTVLPPLFADVAIAAAFGPWIAASRAVRLRLAVLAGVGGARVWSGALSLTGVLRIGENAGVVLFLIGALLSLVFINLYRYALRLAAFHRSRAYMLALSDGDPALLERATRTFSADHVSLGREPRAPIEEAKRLAEIARDLKP